MAQTQLHSPMNPTTTLLIAPLLAASMLVSCRTATPVGLTETQPQAKGNRPWKTSISPLPDLKAERDYITQRRQAVGVAAKAPTIALCFSGGGLRAATLGVGILQGLEETGLLKKVDYLSTVSGGSYVGSWYVSHLLPPGSGTVRSAPQISGSGFNSYSGDRATLLQVNGSPDTGDGGAVDELRKRRGFVLGTGNIHLPWLIPLHLFTLAPAYVFDVALHFKPLRGKFNWHHPAYHYERAIRRTYLSAPDQPIPGQDACTAGPFRGQPHELRLNEINPPGHQAPYLVINATQGNNPDPAFSFDHRATPFEFSRHSVGGPHLGYIHSDHFGYHVESTRKLQKGSGEVALRANPLALLPWFTTKPLRLATAVSASGAAGDPNKGGKPYQNGAEWPPGSCEPQAETRNPSFLKKQFRAQLGNFFTRQQHRNFAMQPPVQPEPPWTLADRVRDRWREVTQDRFRPTQHSNTLILTDGAHFENLGIYAMMKRPDVDEVWSFDVAEDAEYTFKDWYHTAKLLQYEGWELKPEAGEWLQQEPTGVGCPIPEAQTEPWGTGPVLWKRSPVFRFLAYQSKTGRTVRLYFVKNSHRASDGASLEIAKAIWDYRLENRKTGLRFPHTSTGNASFNQKDFDAYREHGRTLGLNLADSRKGVW
jgi:hypothetical protein